MTHTWVRHRETGGYWQCPTDLLAEFAVKGWEPSGAPAEPNPAIAELLAAREAAAKQAETNKPTKPASRGKSEE